MAEPAERLTWCETLIEKLKVQLAVLRRARFGVSPEKFDRAIAQLELALEDIETAAAETAPPPPVVKSDGTKTRPARQPLPNCLPRHDVLHEAGDSCPVCGGHARCWTMPGLVSGPASCPAASCLQGV